jgi:hypothetical protein
MICTQEEEVIKRFMSTLKPLSPLPSPDFYTVNTFLCSQGSCLYWLTHCLQIGILSLLAVGISPALACWESWKGKEYVELPVGFCQGYTDALLGKQGFYEYGGVVCDRHEGSYFFLQRLVRYTAQKKAIWKIVQIKSLPKLRTNELALTQGCRQSHPDQQAILAIVRENGETLTTLKAWAIDFSREALLPLKAKTVICQIEPQPSLLP